MRISTSTSVPGLFAILDATAREVVAVLKVASDLGLVHHEPNLADDLPHFLITTDDPSKADIFRERFSDHFGT